MFYRATPCNYASYVYGKCINQILFLLKYYIVRCVILPDSDISSRRMFTFKMWNFHSVILLGGGIACTRAVTCEMIKRTKPWHCLVQTSHARGLLLVR